MSNENGDLGFLEEAWPEQTDDELEADANPGIKVPQRGVSTRKQMVQQSSGTPVEATIQTWEEIGYVTKLGVKRGNPEGPYAEYNPVSAWIMVKISDAPEHGNTNTGRSLNARFLRFYPGLNVRTMDELKEAAEGAEKGSTVRKLPGRKYDNTTAHRIMASLLRACGFTDRLTRGATGFQAFRGLHTIMDLLTDNGRAFNDIPVKIVIQRGKPSYYGEYVDHEIIDFKPLAGR